MESGWRHAGIAHPPERLEFMLRGFGARALLTDERSGGARPRSGQSASTCMRRSMNARARQSANAQTASLADRRGQFSGSTGKPKGAMILHSGMTNYIWNIEARRDGR